MKIVHFAEEEAGTPSELEANAKSMYRPISRDGFANDLDPLVVDEAFPEITIDLVSVRLEDYCLEVIISSPQLVVRSPFDPSSVAALAHKLGIPTSLMFMSCPGASFPYPVAELGTRIVTR